MKLAKPGHNLNNLGRCLQDEATYQTSILLSHIFIKFFVILVCKTNDPRAII